MDRYPPLKALLAFDAAMRRNSFSDAAIDLAVTPGAVGQQIQKLEDWLGVPLFVRGIRQIQPTAEALAYWAELQPALARIQQASRTLRERSSNTVWLSLPPTLAAKWFAPRMAGLLGRHPDLALHLSASSTLVDFEREAIDLAIRYFDGRDASLDATLLHPDEARVFCSPDYAARLGLAEAPDLARTTLLYSTLQPFWSAWLARYAGLTADQVAAMPALHFDQTLLAIEAARHAQGMVLCSALLVEEELKQGWLVEPFACRLPLLQGYYLVHPHRTPLRPAAQRLKAWLLGLAETERAGAGITRQ